MQCRQSHCSLACEEYSLSPPTKADKCILKEKFKTKRFLVFGVTNNRYYNYGTEPAL